MLGEIFYCRCLGCGFRSESGKPICPDCLDKLERYPHECESCGYPSMLPVKICGMCRMAKHRDRIKILYKYQGALRTLIKEIKFGYRVRGMETLKELVADFQIGEYDIVSDVPSHFTRKFRRVTHPASEIAKYISVINNQKYLKILTRTRRTEYQYKLRRYQRSANVKDAFECLTDVRGLKILLVDDIITTGSTTEECSRILKKSGADRVDVFSLTGGRG